MQRLRSLHHKNRYTQIANDAIDRLPDLESVGLLATILRHSDDFDFQMSVLIKSKPGLGKKRAYAARTTLIEHGYVVQVKFKHTYRGRFCTDIYRSAEPHTAEDLALLRERYALGREVALTDDDGQERLVTIIWAEITSAAGVETRASSEEAGGSPKSQVAPDSALAEPRTGESGTPEPRTGDVGVPEPFKEDWSEESEGEHPDPDGRTDQGAPSGEQHEAAARIRSRLQLSKVGAQPKQVRQIEAALERLLETGFTPRAVELHAQHKLNEANTCKYLLNGLDPEYVEEPAPAAVAAARPEPVPPWCGECDREGRDRPALRRIEIDGAMRRCPNCHPDAVCGA